MRFASPSLGGIHDHATFRHELPSVIRFFRTSTCNGSLHVARELYASYTIRCVHVHTIPSLPTFAIKNAKPESENATCHIRRLSLSWKDSRERQRSPSRCSMHLSSTVSTRIDPVLSTYQQYGSIQRCSSNGRWVPIAIGRLGRQA